MISYICRNFNHGEKLTYWFEIYYNHELHEFNIWDVVYLSTEKEDR